jgi:hypothetical protein
MPESTTVNSANEQTVQIRTMGAEKQCCTRLANSQQTEVASYLVFKCKMMAKEKFP